MAAGVKAKATSRAGPRVDVRIGTAGWGVPKSFAGEFPGEGAHLERYAQRFPVVEIDTSFDRRHRPETYARWASIVPAGFRFAVKAPREITHKRRLVEASEQIEGFLKEIGELGDKLGPVLVQLPPSLVYDEGAAISFFAAVRELFDGQMACEPRHSTWFADPVDSLLSRFRVARVAADPALAPRAAMPGGWPGLVYRRLHGSPDVYYSGYSGQALAAIAAELRKSSGAQNWCIFDNTARGEATGDALALAAMLAPARRGKALPGSSTQVRSSGPQKAP
jgi:uncharacterized protein YecE (DUF72 family)